MARIPYDQPVLRGVYGYFDESGILQYVGSSYLPMQNLDYNHRNYVSKNYGWTRFRGQVSTVGQKWTVRWLIEPTISTQPEIELKEEAAIELLSPLLNDDKKPYNRSIKEERYRKDYTYAM